MAPKPDMWYGVPFAEGDTVLLEWTDPEDPARALWLVPDVGAEAGMELAFDGGVGLLIEGEENIFPDKLTVLTDDKAPFSLEGSEVVAAGDIEIGDVVLVKKGDLLVEFLATEDNLLDADNESYPCVYGANFSFSEEDEDVFYRRI